MDLSDHANVIQNSSTPLKFENSNMITRDKLHNVINVVLLALYGTNISNYVKMDQT